jgi:hypothetical protein
MKKILLVILLALTPILAYSQSTAQWWFSLSPINQMAVAVGLYQGMIASRDILNMTGQVQAANSIQYMLTNGSDMRLSMNMLVGGISDYFSDSRNQEDPVAAAFLYTLSKTFPAAPSQPKQQPTPHL